MPTWIESLVPALVTYVFGGLTTYIVYRVRRYRDMETEVESRLRSELIARMDQMDIEINKNREEIENIAPRVAGLETREDVQTEKLDNIEKGLDRLADGLQRYTENTMQRPEIETLFESVQKALDDQADWLRKLVNGHD